MKTQKKEEQKPQPKLTKDQKKQLIKDKFKIVDRDITITKI